MPWAVAHQASLSMGSPKQDRWCGLPCPSPGDLPNPGIKPASPQHLALQAASLPLSHWGHLLLFYWLCQSLCVVHNKLWKILQDMGVPDHLICLLRNLCAGQEATVRTRLGTMDWFQIRKGVHQGCILSPCLFKLYAEYIMWNARLDEAWAGIKIARRNINNLRYADDPPLWQEVKRN